MQDHVIPTDARASSGYRVTIPATIVDWVRRATYAEIGSAAEKLDTAAFARDREAHPEWFLGPAANLRESYALLDEIGWSKTIPPLAVQIELHDYCWALMRALEGALEFADEDVSELVGASTKNTPQSLEIVPNAVIERVGVLWHFTAEAQARIDALAVQEREGPALTIAA
jgi:hypothetical protein